MPLTDRSARRRAADAFRALDTGGDLAKRRVWRRVERGLATRGLRGQRRLGWIAGIAASAAAAFVFILPPALSAARTWYEPSQQEQQHVAVKAVMEMLGGQQARGTSSGDTTGLGDFAHFLVTGTDTGAK